jgi:hypothetical protein
LTRFLRYFAPETVERIQALIKGSKKPDKVIETPVYEYAILRMQCARVPLGVTGKLPENQG